MDILGCVWRYYVAGGRLGKSPRALGCGCSPALFSADVGHKFLPGTRYLVPWYYLIFIGNLSYEDEKR